MEYEESRKQVKNAYRSFSENLRGRDYLRETRRWKNNIKMDFT
jgi:preprotein translocase subunit Sec63